MWLVPGVPAEELTYEQLCALVARLEGRVGELVAENGELRAENAELWCRLGKNSSNSSRRPSSGAPWE